MKLFSWISYSQITMRALYWRPSPMNIRRLNVKEAEKLTLLFTEFGEMSDADWVIKNRKVNQWAIKLMAHQEVTVDLNNSLNKVTLSIHLDKVLTHSLSSFKHGTT